MLLKSSCRCTVAMSDAYELRRFTTAQADAFPRAVAELRKGRKRSCWMWYVCPTPPFVVDGEEVGSAKNRRYAIRSVEEGRAYLRFRDADADLRANYLEVLGSNHLGLSQRCGF